LQELKYGNGDMILINRVYTYDTTLQEWIGVHKFENVYDAKNRISMESIAFQWDTAGRKWIDHDYHYYEYTEDPDSNTKTQIQTLVYPPDINWYLKVKTVDYYTESNILYQSLSYSSDSSEADLWKARQKIEYTYDSENKGREVKISSWNGYSFMLLNTVLMHLA
jgi:hypothetical protein